jgi:hypothetical protein
LILEEISSRCHVKIEKRVAEIREGVIEPIRLIGLEASL